MYGKSTLNQLRQLHPIEDLLFKRRTVFEITSSEYQFHDLDYDKYNIIKYTGITHPGEVDTEVHQFLRQYIKKKTVTQRFKLENCNLYLARHVDSGKPAGFYWGVHAEYSDLWHDSFQVPQGSGLVFNAYVAPSHRRQGVYRLLQASSHNHLLNEVGCDSIITIVEDRNEGSMRANEEFGLAKIGKNYLIKFLSINILSVIGTSDGRQTHIVLFKGGI